MTRPVSFDAEDYKHGIVVERLFNGMKTGAAWPGATTSSPSSFAAASSSPRSSTGCADQ
jgi:hypothetical protein